MSKSKLCAVYGCMNRGRDKKELGFFSLPQDSHRRFLWLQLIAREELQDKNPHSYTVCEEHFDPLCIVGSSERKILQKYAVPSLKLPNKQFLQKDTQTEIKETLNKFAQTDFYTLKLETSAQTACHLTSSLPCVIKLKDELMACKKRMKAAESKTLTKDTFHKLCDKFLTKPLAEIVKAQTKLKFHGQGNRYTPKYKQFCINLYYTSPQAYKLLEQALCLPSAKTLAKLSLPISTEVNEQLMSTLKVKVNNMSNSEKVCSVVVDAINLKATLFYNMSIDKIIGFQEVNGVQTAVLAKHALVVMIRGIFGNWKQPIGFALIGECRNSKHISDWIEQLLEKLIDVGLDIRTFVSELRSDLLSDEKRNAITTEKPYFYIKNRKIYYIIDALHLIKSLRNNLMLNDFHFEGSVAKYEHILQFYESEKSKSLKLAPKLTESHVNPTNIEKVKVHYATELLSKTVATAISCYIDFQAINESAKETVRFILMINDLFDVLNSSTSQSIYEYQQAFCGSATQITFMKEMLNLFKSLKLINSSTGRDVTSTAKFIIGFQTTITSILLLFDDLRLEGYNKILTIRLNLDVLDVFFGQIRSNKKKPTTRQFMSEFRKFFFSNIIKPGKKGKDIDDLSQLLINSERLGIMSGSENTEDNILGTREDSNEIRVESNAVSISSSDYSKIELPENDGLRYISRYLLGKCIKIHGDCPLLRARLGLINKTSVRMDVDDTMSKDESDVDQEIILPDDFLIFVGEMEKHYQNFFNNQITGKIAASIFESINLLPYSPPCACFPTTYVKKLFIRIRIYVTVKYNNEEFRKQRPKKCFSVAIN